MSNSKEFSSPTFYRGTFSFVLLSQATVIIQQKRVPTPLYESAKQTIPVHVHRTTIYFFPLLFSNNQLVSPSFSITLNKRKVQSLCHIPRSPHKPYRLHSLPVRSFQFLSPSNRTQDNLNKLKPPPSSPLLLLYIWDISASSRPPASCAALLLAR